MTGTLISMVATVLFALLQSFPSDTESTLDQIRQKFISIVMYGGSGFLSIGVVRWLMTRRASNRSITPESTSVSTSGGATVSTTAGGGTTKHNVAFTLPPVLPMSGGIRQVTHNEIHTIELGGGAGFVGGTLGYNRYKIKTFVTIRLGPWYAMLALLGGAGAGWLFFSGGVVV